MASPSDRQPRPVCHPSRLPSTKTDSKTRHDHHVYGADYYHRAPHTSTFIWIEKLFAFISSLFFYFAQAFFVRRSCLRRSSSSSPSAAATTTRRSVRVCLFRSITNYYVVICFELGKYDANFSPINFIRNSDQTRVGHILQFHRPFSTAFVRFGSSLKSSLGDVAVMVVLPSCPDISVHSVHLAGDCCSHAFNSLLMMIGDSHLSEKRDMFLLLLLHFSIFFFSLVKKITTTMRKFKGQMAGFTLVRHEI